MICPKCKEEIKDGLDICDKCGEKIKAKKFKISDRPHSRRGLVLMLCLIIVICSFLTFAFLHQSAKKAPDMALYVKNSEIYMSDFSLGNSKVTSSLVTNCADQKNALSNLKFSKSALISDDLSYLFYPDNIVNSRAGFTLYAKNLTNPNVMNQKIATSVMKYFVSSDAKYLTYINTNNSLYLYDVKAKRGEKLCKNVLSYDNAIYINDNHSKIYYVDASTYDIYLKEHDKKSEKIDTAISYIANVTSDFKTLFYVKDHTLYKKELGEEKVKIADSITAFIKGYENGECYYIKKSEKESSDDIPYELNTLCYYDKEEVLLSNGITNFDKDSLSSFTCGEKTPSIVYKALDISLDDSKEMLKLNDTSWYFAKKDKITKLLNHNNISLYQISDDAKKIACLVYPDKESTLCDLYMISFNKDAKATEIFTDNNVSDVMSFFTDDNKFVYIKDANGNIGDLYIDDTYISENVYLNKVYYNKDTKEIIFYTDYDLKDNEGTLNVYKDSKVSQIAKAVSSYEVIDDNSIIYLCDFSQNTNTGSLYRFKDSKSTHLDDGVEFIMGY